jgi:Ca2+-transporting ATPase
MSTTHRLVSSSDTPVEKYATFVKGGVDTTLPCCTHALLPKGIVALDESLRSRILAENEQFAKGGFRTLAFAVRERDALPTDDANVADVETGLVYVGLVAEQDPARPEVPAAVRTAQEAGIRIAMVTGDHALTACAIAREIGILPADDTDDSNNPQVLTGIQLEAMSDEELATVAPDICVYARVNPEHKIRIVSALNTRGHVVAMTGDGDNDAPALKRADIGVAMGVVGTDVTREAADMVLSDDNFSTIVAAVEEGRTVFANLKKVILFLLSCNIAEVLIVAITALFNFGAHLLPLQLLWINLITDGLPALALGIDPPEHDVMKRRPRDAGKPILTFPRWTQIFSQGAVMTAAGLLVAYVIGPALKAPPEDTLTMLFSTIVLCELLHIFAYRSETKSVFSREVFKNKWLIITFVVSLALQIVVIHVPVVRNLFHLDPLTPLGWVAVIVVSFAAMAINDGIGLIIDRVMRDKE